MASSQDLCRQIEERLGFFPPFFEPAREQPAVLDNLWHQTRAAYLDSALPALFKDKLAALLGRFSSSPYGLVCHSCSLLTSGLGGQQVYELLQRGVPDSEQLAWLFPASDGRWTEWPESGSPREGAVLDCAVSLFLGDNAELCRDRLRRSLPGSSYDELILLLSYNRACHGWVEAHPEISYERDQRAELHLKPLLDEEPRLSGLLHRGAAGGATRDAAVVQQLRDQVQATEAQLRALVEVTPQMLFVGDAEGNMVYFNQQFYDYAGRSSDDLLHWKWRGEGLHHPDDLEMTVARWGAAVQSGEPYEITYRLRRHDGAYRWFLGRALPVRDADGKIVRWYGTNTDIQEARALAEELKVSRDHLEQAVRAAGLGFWRLDVASATVTWSEQLRILYDFPEGQLQGSLEEVLARVEEADRELVRAGVQASVRDGVPYHLEFRVRNESGKVRWLECQGELEAGGATLAGTALDVTHRVLAATDLAQARDAAEAASATKSAFLANISHELRTPLGSIMGFVELMKMPGQDAGEKLDYLNIVERNSRQLLRIIDDILDLSKVEAGKMRVEVLDVSLSEWLADFASFMGPQAREKGLTFALNPGSGLPNHIQTDPTRLRQILTNMVGNAIKFTAEGSVLVEVEHSDDSLCFTVRDTGIGISEEGATQLFQPFHQADISTTRRFGGTGLGLALTRRLCELMEGEFVLLESRLGEGSSFRARVKAAVSLPEQTGDFPVALEGERSARGLDLLVVDDSPDNRRLLRHYLEGAGARVTLADNGREAVDLVRSRTFDGVLMDVQMPVMDGREAARQLRDSGFAGPVVALTAHAMRDEKERCLAAGFTHFLTKPVSRRQLLDLFSSFRLRQQAQQG